MLKEALVVSALLASAQSVQAQADDPTFNGLVAMATCYVRNVTACQAASCEQVARDCQGDLCGTFHLFLKDKQFNLLTGRQPLRIVETSPAQVGKPLWVKFEVPTKDGAGEGRLTLRPERLGGYVTTAVVFVPAAGDPSGRSFSLINYACEAESGDP